MDSFRLGGFGGWRCKRKSSVLGGYFVSDVAVLEGCSPVCNGGCVVTQVPVQEFQRELTVRGFRATFHESPEHSYHKSIAIVLLLSYQSPHEEARKTVKSILQSESNPGGKIGI